MTYREVEVHWQPASNHNRVTVSNHFGGFTDALVLLAVLPTRPGIVARDVIWKIPVAGSLMNWVGGIPVHKPEDRGSATSNDEMFASCYDALDGGGHILIFPEGVTRNEPSIAPVKTGAARIALGARAAGTTGIRILPVGIHYEDKAALRSRVFVNGGVPIDVDEVIAARESSDGEVDANDREAVRALTDDIDVALRRAAPDFENWDEARALAKASEITLRSQLDDPAGAVPIGLRDRLANTLADRPEASRRRIVEAVEEYRNDLDGVGYNDAELHGALKARSFLTQLIFTVVALVILFPFALVGALINVIPWLIVKAVGLIRMAPSVAASVKPIAAFVVFGITWGVVIWQAVSRYGWEAGVAAFVLLPIYLALVVAFIDRVADLWRAFRRWRATSGSKGLEEAVAEHRRAIVEAVIAA